MKKVKHICLLVFIASQTFAQMEELVFDLHLGPEDGFSISTEVFGTVENTIILKDDNLLYASDGSPSPFQIFSFEGSDLGSTKISLGESFYFVLEGLDFDQLYRYSTTDEMYMKVGEIAEDISNLIVYKERLYFEQTNLGNSVFVSMDPNTEGMEEVFTMSPGGMQDNVIHKDLLYFIQWTDQGAYLSSSNGDVGNTTEIHKLYEGSENGELQNINMTSAGDQLFFWYHSEADPYSFYVSDGTSLGTRIISDEFANVNDYNFDRYRSIETLGNQIFFLATKEEETNYNLWVSDGSIAGTEEYIFDQTINSNPSFFINYGGKIYFRVIYEASYFINMSGAFVSDGTKAGTELMIDRFSAPGDYRDDGWNLINHQGKFYHGARNSDDGFEIYEYDPETEINTIFTQLAPNNEYSGGSNFASANENLFFLGVNDEFGRELYVVRSPTSSVPKIEIKPFEVSPNPASSEIYVHQHELNGNQFELVDIQGRLQLRGILMNQQINIDLLNTGMYYLKVKTAEKIYLSRFIKSN